MPSHAFAPNGITGATDKADEKTQQHRRKRKRVAARKAQQQKHAFEEREVIHHFQTMGDIREKKHLLKSNSRALMARKLTIAKAYDKNKRGNSFKDSRIDTVIAKKGKMNSRGRKTAQDKMFLRFLRQRKKRAKYQLSDDENDDDFMSTGTSGKKKGTGVSASAFPIDDYVDSDSDSDEAIGGLFTIVKDDKKNKNADDEPPKKKTKREKLEEIIQKSKFAKFQEQEEKADLTGEIAQLDLDWTAISSTVKKGSANLTAAQYRAKVLFSLNHQLGSNGP